MPTSIRLAVVLVVIGVTAAAFWLVADGFRIEASSQSLVLEGDDDWQLYERTQLEFASDELILVALERKDDLFTPAGAAHVKRLTERFERIVAVDQAPSFGTGASWLLVGETSGLTDAAGVIHLELTGAGEGGRFRVAGYRDESFAPAAKVFETTAAAPGEGVNVTGVDGVALIGSGAIGPQPRAGARGRLETGLVKDVLSIANVQLFESHAKLPPMMVALQSRMGTSHFLDSKDTVLQKAKKELTNHAAYVGNIISPDGEVAGIAIYLDVPPGHEALSAERSRLQYRLDEPGLPPEERRAAERRLREIEPEYERLEDIRKENRVKVVRIAKELVAAEAAKGHTIAMSGIPVIVIDMVDAIEQDFRWFGLAAVGFLVVFLGIVFRRGRWVVLPLFTCLGTATWVLALMVLEGKRTTVVTANLPSLLVVIGMAHSIHFIVRYRELLAGQPNRPDAERVGATIRAIWVPCFFTALTTGIGFGSLAIARIEPVIDFGIHMAVGVVLAFVLTFTFLPAGVRLLRPLGEREGRMEGSAATLGALSEVVLRWPAQILVLAAVLGGLALVGMMRLEVETRFIDYFRKDSPVYENLNFVDEKMGGTTGIEVVIEGPGKDYFKKEEGLLVAARIQAYMEERPEIGTVLSMTDMARQLRKVLGMRTLPQAAAMVPSVLERDTTRPYVVEDWSKVRIVGRVYEAYDDLDRTELLRELRTFCELAAIGTEADAKVTGIFVAYTNMLESLTQSNVSTTALVFGLLFVVFALIFRSVRAGLIAMVPNAVPILYVMGVMGFAGIHLDMATVMIASVALGISVDGTIHYLFRFRSEVRGGADPAAAIRRSHRSIGTAMLFTSLTAVAGFWVLALSNFVPNVSFGLLTGVAMIAAIFADLTVLPVLILWTRPFSPARKP